MTKGTNMFLCLIRFARGFAHLRRGSRKSLPWWFLDVSTNRSLTNSVLPRARCTHTVIALWKCLEPDRSRNVCQLLSRSDTRSHSVMGRKHAPKGNNYLNILLGKI